MCPAGTLREGTTTLTLERDGSTIVLKNVPAEVCDTCGEAYIDEEVSADVYARAGELVDAGAETVVQQYRAPTKAAA
jgi:YgiT-type zinc finger domain-containing protein